MTKGLNYSGLHPLLFGQGCCKPRSQQCLCNQDFSPRHTPVLSVLQVPLQNDWHQLGYLTVEETENLTHGIFTGDS